MIFVISGTQAEYQHWSDLTCRLAGEATRLTHGVPIAPIGHYDTIEFVGTWWHTTRLRPLLDDLYHRAGAGGNVPITRVLAPMLDTPAHNRRTRQPNM